MLLVPGYRKLEALVELLSDRKATVMRRLELPG